MTREFLRFERCFILTIFQNSSKLPGAIYTSTAHLPENQLLSFVAARQQWMEETSNLGAL